MIKKVQSKKTYNQFGFTLIEMLVVIAVLSVMGAVLTEVFVRTSRANAKTQVVAIIKQNGQAALETMDKTTRNATEVLCPIASDTASDTLVVSKISELTQAKEFFRFKYTAPTSAVNGKITQDNPTTFNPATDCTAAQTSPVNLTDTNTQKGVSISSPDAGGPFIRNISPGYNNTVAIRFTVGRAVLSPAAIAGQIDPVEFKTTVVLRLKI